MIRVSTLIFFNLINKFDFLFKISYLAVMNALFLVVFLYLAPILVHLREPVPARILVLYYTFIVIVVSPSMVIQLFREALRDLLRKWIKRS